MGHRGPPRLVYALAAFNGQLVAGGRLTTAGGSAGNGVVAWNGSSRSSLGGGMGGTPPYVNALTVCNGQLVAAGWFTSAGGVPCNFIARWGLTGDINADAHVDVVDLLSLAGSWARSAGDPGFDSACDLNNNGGVDVVDLLLLADNWGR